MARVYTSYQIERKNLLLVYVGDFCTVRGVYFFTIHRLPMSIPPTIAIRVTPQKA